MISLAISSNKKVLQLKKRLKETSFKAKIAQEPFGNNVTKELLISAIANSYNYYMGAIDKFDYLIAQNAGLYYVKCKGA